jgi:predicted nucleotidyltransferase
MIDLIEDNRQAIEDLCRQYGVKRLAVFGSAAKGTFDPATSDLDFVVEMADYGPGVAMRFLSFGVALEDLLGRSVDLVTERSIKKPWFRDEVYSTMELLFDDNARRSGKQQVA